MEPMTEMVKSVSIENMLNQRAAVMEKIEAAIVLLRDAHTISAAAHLGFPRIQLSTNRYALHTMLDDDRIDDTRKAIAQEVDSEAWAYLMKESGLRTFMDAKARAEFDKQIYDKSCPALTYDTVAETFKGLYSARGEMFERGVILVFKSLSWDYKTNRPYSFGKRIVLRNLRGKADGRLYSGFGFLNNRSCDELDDLVRVFSVLDGKPEPDHRHAMYAQISAAGSSSELEADYFQVRWFKNGNGHLTFKRSDLVNKMNKILAKHYPNALPYDQHCEESS
jgi:hypothetical protein